MNCQRDSWIFAKRTTQLVCSVAASAFKQQDKVWTAEKTPIATRPAWGSAAPFVSLEFPDVSFGLFAFLFLVCCTQGLRFVLIRACAHLKNAEVRSLPVKLVCMRAEGLIAA